MVHRAIYGRGAVHEASEHYAGAFSGWHRSRRFPDRRSPPRFARRPPADPGGACAELARSKREDRCENQDAQLRGCPICAAGIASPRRHCTAQPARRGSGPMAMRSSRQGHADGPTLVPDGRRSHEKKLRTNDLIRAREIRVIRGRRVSDRPRAGIAAGRRGRVGSVEVSPESTPPVCRILD
jgi:hypothetical protein